MEFVALIAIAALVKKGLDLVKYVRANDVNGYVTLLAAMVLGVLVIVLAAHTAFAGGLVIGGIALAKMGFWSQVFVGLTIAGSAGVTTDFLKSVDNSTSAAVPALVGGTVPGVTTGTDGGS